MSPKLPSSTVLRALGALRPVSSPPSRRVAQLATLAALTGFLPLAAFAGSTPGDFNSNHSLRVHIAEDAGLSWSVEMSSLLSYDPTTGALKLPEWGSTLGTGWEWTKVAVADPSDPATLVERDALRWHTAERVGDDSTPWRSTFTIYATGNVDPFLTYAFSARNNTGATQSYVFTYGESIVPPVGGDYVISADIAGSLTNGVAGSTAKFTPDGADFDGDGILEAQVLKISTDNGLTFLASGVDVGPEFETSTAAGTTVYGAFSASATGTAPVDINYWEIETRFTLSPGRDAIALSGYAEINAAADIPEPSAYATFLGVFGLGALYWRRRRERPTGDRLPA